MQARRVMPSAEAQGRRVGKMVVVLRSLRLRVSARESLRLRAEAALDQYLFKSCLPAQIST
jgi:hypothetical protein